MADNVRPRVVIVGGGFGGLVAAREFAGKPVDVTVVDRTNYHLFQPMLYQVATAAISVNEIAQPIRSILRRQKNARVLMANVLSVNLAERRLELDEHAALDYDYLILAPGVRHSYFGHDEWEADAPGLKNVEDAFRVRQRIFTAYEEAEREQDPERRAELMTFVIIGGGPTGAELAGSLAEIAHHTLSRDFRSIDPTHSRVLLVEGGPRILPSFPPDLSEHAERLLKKIGVEVRTGSIVTGVDKDGVLLGEERIKAGTVLWAAGVTASPLLKSLGVPLDRAGRVSVQPDLSVADHPEVFVVGDAAAILPAGAERPLPGVAQVAMQSGKVAAANILRLVGGGATQPFAYNDRGNMATLGRAAAVAQIGTWHSSGIVAWWLWLTIHLAYIIGFRNRAQVMLQWTWSYFTWERGARLITKVGNE